MFHARGFYSRISNSTRIKLSSLWLLSDDGPSTSIYLICFPGTRKGRIRDRKYEKSLREKEWRNRQCQIIDISVGYRSA